MVQLRIYDKAGSTLASMTSPVANGALDHLGGNMFISTNSATVEQFYMSDSAATLMRTLVTFGANTDGVGVLCRSSHHRWWDELDADGPELLIATNEAPGGAAAYGIRNYSYDGTLNASTTFFGGIVTAWGGMCGNGHELYFALTDSSPSTDVYIAELSGATIANARHWAFTTLPQDMTYDGHYLWTIEGTTCKQYEQDGKDLPRLCNSFALTGLTPAGICTDGEFLYVLSRS